MIDTHATREHYPAILSATEPEPRTRIRIEHARTQRDGWGYSTTVEVTYDGTDDSAALDRLDELLMHARALGEHERDARTIGEERP